MSEKIYVVTEQEAGQRLDQFLKEVVLSWSALSI